MTTMLTAQVDLGAGHVAAFVWRRGASREQAIPAGIIDHHGSCSTYVMWAADPDRWEPNDDLWTLITLRPLEILEPFRCTTCGEEGRIVQGKWVPS